jgi:glycosyltransferase involved in cell wall biosynthesis
MHNNETETMRVLVSAYACQPGRGSEPGVGWNWVRQISKHSQVWVITRENNRRHIEAALAREPIPSAHFFYFDLPAWARSWKKGRRGVHPYYYLWQFCAYLLARKLHRQVGFDLVHHVTFVNYWMPSFMVLLPVPFLWGPVGGGESAPKAFWDSFSLRGKIYETVRDLARKLASLDPFVRLTARRAVLALATTSETASRVRALGCSKVSVLPQVGLAREELSQLREIPARDASPFRVLSVGSLVHLKGFDLGFKAYRDFLRVFPESEYWLVGAGPERKRLEGLARSLGIAQKVKFWGELPRPQVLEMFAKCDVLLHPTLHDSGGCVSLEAMAAGRPVICLDLGGLSLQVTRETGFKIPPISPKQAIRDISKALVRLAANPQLRKELGQAGRRRVEEQFGWDQKGDLMMHLYRLVCSNGNAEMPAAALLTINQNE